MTRRKSQGKEPKAPDKGTKSQLVVGAKGGPPQKAVYPEPERLPVSGDGPAGDGKAPWVWRDLVELLVGLAIAYIVLKLMAKELGLGDLTHEAIAAGGMSKGVIAALEIAVLGLILVGLSIGHLRRILRVSPDRRNADDEGPKLRDAALLLGALTVSLIIYKVAAFLGP